MYRRTKCSVIDNSGAKVVRVIHTRNSPAPLGSVVLVSIVKRNFNRRRIKFGQVFRALVLSCGFQFSRISGQFIRGPNNVVLLKRSDVITISKRIKGPVPLELRRLKFSKILSMGSYVF